MNLLRLPLTLYPPLVMLDLHLHMLTLWRASTSNLDETTSWIAPPTQVSIIYAHTHTIIFISLRIIHVSKTSTTRGE